MNRIEVSIITPSYNRAELLPRAWKSIQGQNAPFEWIVVDDGSTDATRDVINNLADDRIVYTPLARNSGVNVARNRGVAISRGRYVVFLDSDDELYPDSLGYMVALMDAAIPEVGAAVFACVVAETGRQVSELPDGELMGEYESVCLGKLYDGGEKLLVFRREVFDDFLLPEDLRGCEQVFVYSVSKKWKYLLINRPLRVIHRQEDNLSNADSIIARSYDIARSYEMLTVNHREILGKNVKVLTGFLKKSLYRYGVSGHRKDAWRIYRLLLTQPATLSDILSATAYLLLALFGAPLFEKLRINRINDKFLGAEK